MSSAPVALHEPRKVALGALGRLEEQAELVRGEPVAVLPRLRWRLEVEERVEDR